MSHAGRGIVRVAGKDPGECEHLDGLPRLWVLHPQPNTTGRERLQLAVHRNDPKKWGIIRHNFGHNRTNAPLNLPNYLIYALFYNTIYLFAKMLICSQFMRNMLVAQGEGRT